MFRVYSAVERIIPNTIRQAQSSPDHAHWNKAIQAEVDSLANNDTLIIEPLPHGKKLIGLKWVFKIKETAEGLIERYKARCVALGFMQILGMDYWETFSPTAKHSTVRALLAKCAQSNHHVHHMDVDTAFLYGVLPESEQVYVEIPQGYPIPPELVGVPNLAGRLRKGIYGLKQAPRLWNQSLDATLRSANFTPSQIDPCLYTRTDNGQTHYVLVYVDDLIVAGPNMNRINEFKSHMSKNYRMKDLGHLNYFLGMQVAIDRSAGTIRLSQSKYINDLKKTFRVSDSIRTTNIPMQPNTVLRRTPLPTTSDTPSDACAHKAKKAKKNSNPIQYRELVGSLMYLMVCSRPDIAFSVSYLARYLNCFDETHFAQAMKLLHYVIQTSHLGITYSRDSTVQPYGYSDSDWGTDIETRKSTTGYVYLMSGGAVSWKSKLQPTVALSSADAEYMALSASTQEALYLRMLCSDLHISCEDLPTVIHADNQSAMAMANNPTMTAANKHINIRHHFIRDHIKNEDVVLRYVNTLDNAADLLTKALPFESFSKHRGLILNLA
jgi:hypothetical protein